MTTLYRSWHVALVASTLACLVSPANAETWRAVSMIVGDERVANPVNTFADRIDDNTPVLSNRPDGSPSNIEDVRITIGFLDMRDFIPDSRPVEVNADTGTINLSSIYATGWRAELDCTVQPATCDKQKSHLVWIAAIGWDFGPVQALPFVKTLDGSMVATWNAVASRVSQFDGFGNRRVQFTFAQSLPATQDGMVENHRATPGMEKVSDVSAR